MADTSQATYEPVVKLPKPPKHLGKIAAEAWSTYGKELIDSSVLCVTDLAALEQFAIWWEQFRLADNPRDAEKASDQVRRCMTELGLTPSSRSRVKAVTVPKLDEKAAKYFSDPLGVRRR